MHLRNLFLFVFLYALSAGQEVYSQSNDVDGTVRQLMQEARNGKGVTLKDTLLGKVTDEKKRQIFKALKPYNHDDSEKVRFAAQSLEFEIAQTTENLEINQQVVDVLSKGISDHSSLISHQAIKFLFDFEEKNFTSFAKLLITTQIKKDKDIDPNLVKLAGVAGIEALKADLRRVIQEFSMRDSAPEFGRWYGTVGWAANLALARLGERDAISYVIQKVGSEPDALVTVTRLLEDVAYIRQPEAVKFVEDYLYSEKRFPALFDGDEGGKISQQAVFQLAKMIENFPLAARSGYNENEIELARTWMRAHANYVIKK